jgi:hypothetical protein
MPRGEMSSERETKTSVVSNWRFHIGDFRFHSVPSALLLDWL